jgi:hypothetical protein
MLRSIIEEFEFREGSLEITFDEPTISRVIKRIKKFLIYAINVEL